jgi:hypothetical protein
MQRTGMITITVEILDARTVPNKLSTSPFFTYLGVVVSVPDITITSEQIYLFQIHLKVIEQLRFKNNN